MSKRILSVFGALAILVGACSSSATPAPSSGGGAAASAAASTPYISIVSKGFQHQFWQAVKKGAEDEAAKEGATVNFMGPNTESDVRPAAEHAARPSSPRSRRRCASRRSTARRPPRLLQQFQDAKIPVIAFDSGVDSDIPLTTVATDNVAAAALAADKMASSHR